MSQMETCQLLKECTSGIKMAIDAIHEVLPNVKSQTMKDKLSASEKEHKKLESEAENLLKQYRVESGEPGMMARGMAWMKTNLQMSVNPGDDTVANLMSTGCDMGIRNLYKALNDNTGASEGAKALVKKVIKVEEDLGKEMQEYL